MTDDSLDTLTAMVTSDDALLKRLSQLADTRAVAEELAGVAQEKGLTVSVDEIMARMTPSVGGPDDELDEQALAAVTGGGSPYCIFTQGCYCFGTV